MSNGKSSEFFKDIEPFFVRSPVIYVDVGANRGDVFHDLMQSGLNMNRALLFEPNPKAFAKLTESVSALGASEKATCYNIAMSGQASVVQLRDMDDMSKILTVDAQPDSTGGAAVFDVRAETLDSFVSNLPDGHISILKIDVEGHEVEVLKGASKLLNSQSVDIIYIEAGLNPHSDSQTYYRTIEDILLTNDYRLFKIYEQTHEWIENSPFLRRVNMAFMSSKFALHHPFSLVRELRTVRLKMADSLKKANEQKDMEVAALKAGHKSKMDEITVERDGLIAEISSLNVTRRAELDEVVAEREHFGREVADLKNAHKVELDTVSAECERLSNEISTLKGAHKATLDEVTAECERLGNEAATLKGVHKAELEEITAECERLGNEASTLKGAHKAELEEITAECVRLGNEISTLKAVHKAELDEAATQREHQNKEISDRFKEIAVLTQLVEQKEDEASQKENEIANYKNEIEKRDREISRREIDVLDCKNDIAKYKGDISKYKNEISRQKSEILRQENEIEKQKNRVLREKRETDLQKQERARIFSEKTKQINRIKDERDKLSRKVDVLRESVSWKITSPVRKVGAIFRAKKKDSE